MSDYKCTRSADVEGLEEAAHTSAPPLCFFFFLLFVRCRKTEAERSFGLWVNTIETAPGSPLDLLSGEDVQ